MRPTIGDEQIKIMIRFPQQNCHVPCAVIRDQQDLTYRGRVCLNTDIVWGFTVV